MGSPGKIVAAAATMVAVAVGGVLAYVIQAKRAQAKITPRIAALPGQAQNVVWNKSLAELPANEAVPIVDGAYLLGEGVSWDSIKQELWWVDIEGKKILTLRQSQESAIATIEAEGWDVPSRPGSLAVREGGGYESDCPLIVSFEDAFSFYNPLSGKRVSVVPPSGEGDAGVDDYEQISDTRLNDGKCDRQGRFICGGLNLENIDMPADVWKPRAGVYRVEAGRGVRRILPNETFRCYNSTCFSPDGTTMYAADTPLMKINAYDYNVTSGQISNKRVFIDFEDALPDGATVDSEGCLWVALYGKGEVRRYGPDGQLLRTIQVPGARRTTCVAFGGKDLDILFVTSASAGLTDAERMDQPNAGALFAIRLEGIKGIPESYYHG